MGKRSPNQLFQKQEAEATRSQYKRGQRDDEGHTKKPNKPLNLRSSAAPKDMVRTHHQKSKRPNAQRTDTHSRHSTDKTTFPTYVAAKTNPKPNSLSDKLSQRSHLWQFFCSETIETQLIGHTDTVALDRHFYDKNDNKWRKSSQPQPFVTMTIATWAIYQDFSHLDSKCPFYQREHPGTPTKWLLDRNSASTCKHQRQPLMDTIPMIVVIHWSFI